MLVGDFYDKLSHCFCIMLCFGLQLWRSVSADLFDELLTPTPVLREGLQRIYYFYAQIVFAEEKNNSQVSSRSKI